MKAGDKIKEKGTGDIYLIAETSDQNKHIRLDGSNQWVSREHFDLVTSEENKSIPPIILWLFYSLFFAILLVPFIFTWKWLCGSLVLGHFSSQLNLLRNKK